MDRAARRRAQRLGPAFGRLTKAQQAEILELRGSAAKRRFEELDTARRERVRERSHRRRVIAREQARRRAFENLFAQWSTGATRPVNENRIQQGVEKMNARQLETVTYASRADLYDLLSDADYWDDDENESLLWYH